MPTFIEKLRSLSDKQKIAIIVAVVVVAVVLMGYFWITSAANSISKISDSANAIPLPKLDIPDLQTPQYTTQADDKTQDWKRYANVEGKFSLQYPSDWVELDGANNDDTMKTVIFSGAQGDIQVSYGSGFGGACQKGYEKINIGSEEFDVCHYIKDDDSEQWDVSGKQFGDIGIAMFANAKKPHLSNRNTILNILSTLKFTK